MRLPSWHTADVSLSNVSSSPCWPCWESQTDIGDRMQNGVHWFWTLTLMGEQGVVLFCPSDNVGRSQCANAPRCVHYYTVITPSWIIQQISIEKCPHRGASARRKKPDNVQNCHLDKTNMDKTSQHLNGMQLLFFKKTLSQDIRQIFLF